VNFFTVTQYRIRPFLTSPLWREWNDVIQSENLLRTMMDMYARSGSVTAMKPILEKLMNPSVSLYGFMMKVFGDSDKIDDAIDVFHTMLNDQRIKPNIHTFNILLNACAQSKLLERNAYERAYELINVLCANERCAHLAIRPDVITYNTLLKCLSRSTSSSSSSYQSIGVQAVAILSEMESRSKTDPRLKPTLITYNLAIQACLRVNDQFRMDAIMNIMQEDNIRPDTRLCNTIMNYYAQTGTIESADQSESFLASLKVMGQTDATVRPNVYTYNIVLNAVGRSNHPNFAQRMWSIYESMIVDQVAPDGVTYKTLLSYFAREPNSISRADELLLESERNKFKHVFRPDFPCYAMVIHNYLKFNNVENATKLLFRWMYVCTSSSDTRKGINATSNAISNIQDQSMTSTYYQLLQAWIQKGEIEQATSVVEKIQLLYDSKEQNLYRSIEPPNKKIYALLYKAWDESVHPSKDTHMAKLRENIDTFQ
jgi:pentatricopeptide repeat protein